MRNKGFFWRILDVWWSSEVVSCLASEVIDYDDIMIMTIQMQLLNCCITIFAKMANVPSMALRRCVASGGHRSEPGSNSTLARAPKVPQNSECVVYGRWGLWSLLFKLCALVILSFCKTLWSHCFFRYAAAQHAEKRGFLLPLMAQRLSSFCEQTLHRFIQARLWLGVLWLGVWWSQFDIRKPHPRKNTHMGSKNAIEECPGAKSLCCKFLGNLENLSVVMLHSAF